MLLGVGVHRGRAHVQTDQASLPLIKSTILLKHSYIYDFGPRQCLAMPASSFISCELANEF